MSEYRLPLDNPQPDCRRFAQAVLTQYQPDRPVLSEYSIHPSLSRRIVTRLLGRQWVDPTPRDRPSQMAYWDNMAWMWYRLGYDCVRVEIDARLPHHRHRLPRRPDHYIGLNQCDFDGYTGPIACWEDFRAYPWPAVTEADLFPVYHLARVLPAGMGILVGLEGGVFQHLAGLMGFLPLCEALYEQPGLVEAVADRLGDTMAGFYQPLLAIERVTGVFQGDELAHPGGTFISPEHLRHFILPWHTRLAALAHDAGRPYFLHTPGDIEAIMPALLDEVGIDGRHGCNDGSIVSFKRRWGTRLGVFGGIDEATLSFGTPAQVREHARQVIDQCAAGGGFALGASKAIHSHVPLGNYLAMLHEASRNRRSL